MAQWTWNGGAWVMGPSNPPWDMISARGWQPNGDNSGGAHWVVRRWVSSATGSAVCHIAFAKENVSCGNGATLRVFQNGIPIFSHTLSFDDGSGIRADLPPMSLQAGDLLDFALDPAGLEGGANDSCDGCTFAATIEQTASAGAVWNSTATATRSAGESAIPEEIDLTNFKDFLLSGTNVLALHCLNAAADSPDFLILPELGCVRNELDPANRVYFSEPTPGAANGPGATNMGPVVSHAGHAPSIPSDGDDIVVTVRVTPTAKPVGAVILKYRIMYGAEYSVSMRDDGQHADGAADDGVFGASIPAAMSRPGQMVRYYILAADAAGAQTRSPSYEQPRNSPQYYGAVVSDPALANSRLPVLHWFMANPAAADSDATARVVRFFTTGNSTTISAPTSTAKAPGNFQKKATISTSIRAANSGGQTTPREFPP